VTKQTATVESIQSAITPILEETDVRTAGIFGSYLHGDAGPSSDVDILVTFAEPKSLLDIVRLERRLEDALGQPVDVVTKKALSPYFRDAVLDEINIIYDKG
jgi:predicted nucleotidyltransferase